MAWLPECRYVDPKTHELTDIATLRGFECVFRNIVQLATYFALLVVFMMLVSGGFKYITSGGDPKQVESAKNTITYAILGLVALIGIWLLLKFIKVFTGVDVTQFTIGPTPTPTP